MRRECTLSLGSKSHPFTMEKTSLIRAIYSLIKEANSVGELMENSSLIFLFLSPPLTIFFR